MSSLFLIIKEVVKIKIELVNIELSYVEFLYQFDCCVPFLRNKKEFRPFVGVLFEINNVKYYAPLSSPKNKFFNMKNAVDFEKINNGKWGAINFNNMIPVLDNEICPVDLKISASDDTKIKKYKSLLIEQLNWCRKNQDIIIKKAKKLYGLRYITSNLKLASRCCDFKLLEKKCIEYEEIMTEKSKPKCR